MPLPLLLTLTVQGSMPTILAARVRPGIAPPGSIVRIEYGWRATPLERDASVFVHFVGSRGDTALQDDHAPPVATSRWSGPLAYVHRVRLPNDMPAGRYRIEAGLYVASADGKGWRNLALIAGPGVIAGADAHCTIGTLTVDPHAPRPPRDSDRKPTLNLKGYRLTFDESFAGPLSVSAWGPAGPGGTRWIAHKPDGGDFGDARFVDPTPGFPFTVKDGRLRIEARWDADGWKAGILSTCDGKGGGFAQTYGYFEMRARFPKGPGVWPAFWMLQRDHLTDPRRPDVEIDVVEEYGNAPDAIHATLHLWNPGDHRAYAQMEAVADTTADFHRYGLLWDARSIVWYFDGVETFRQATPPEAHRPMYLLVDLALGGGWPTDRTPNPSIMEIDRILAYAREGVPK